MLSQPYDNANAHAAGELSENDDDAASVLSEGGGASGNVRGLLRSEACGLSPCEYLIGGLTKGQRYFVRVFAYNKYGFSDAATPSAPASETPCTYAHPPSLVTVLPVSPSSPSPAMPTGDSPGASALIVAFAPSPEDGGCPVTRYKIEWDPAGALGFAAGSVT